jgi:4-hydroxybenzoate polyprenyltransferase
MSKVKSYLSLIKFSHTIFAMPFALIGFCLAISAKPFILGSPGPGWHSSIYSPSFLLIKFVSVILCMVFARSAAMAFNRYLDRKFDALNPRTAIREIPKGIITPKNALVFTVVNCVLFIAPLFHQQYLLLSFAGGIACCFRIQLYQAVHPALPLDIGTWIIAGADRRVPCRDGNFSLASDFIFAGCFVLGERF